MPTKNAPHSQTCLHIVSTFLSQTIPIGGDDVVLFDLPEYDVLNEWNTINHRFVPKHQGYYLFIYQCNWRQKAASTFRRIDLRDVNTFNLAWDYDYNQANRMLVQKIVVILHLNVGEWIECRASHGQIGNEEIELGANITSWINISRVR